MQSMEEKGQTICGNIINKKCSVSDIEAFIVSYPLAINKVNLTFYF